MTKKTYSGPKIYEVDPTADPGIVLPPSQGTSGEDPQFTWDPAIDPADVTMFWANHDEIDLAAMDTNHDLYISADEFNTWLQSIGGW